MDQRSHQYATASGVLAWTSHTTKLEPSMDDELADTDEPPDSYATISPLSEQFRRTSLRRPSEQHESLLTKALQSHSEDDEFSETTSVAIRRRRSMTSNTSYASATDMSCDTGITTPARTSTPSPRLPGGPFGHHAIVAKPVSAAGSTTAQKSAEEEAAVEVLKKKRCISFACAAKPKTEVEPQPPKPAVVVSKPAGTAPQRRTCIRFACSTQSIAKVASPERTSTPIATTSPKRDSPVTVVKHRSPSAIRLSRPSLISRRSSKSPVAVRLSKKWLTADSKDLDTESSRYHAFASDVVEEDDWIRRDQKPSNGRITIDDTLKKENAIRKLGEEVEQEEELEEQLEDEDDNDDGDDAADENDDEEDDIDAEEDGDYAEQDDDETIDGSDADGGSDGYNTDNEVGFAESDEEDDDLDLWTTGLAATHQSLAVATPVRRRASLAGEVHSDSSVDGKNRRRTRAKRVPRAPTPELPDSTDFVCGTLDEDKPLEEAYVSRMVARRKEKLHPIPQDIDPSFPTSEPEDEAPEHYHHGHHGSDGQVFGDMEDISDAGARKDRRQRSPKRYHSPPPKRHPSPAPKRQHSPAPKARGRSPRRLFDGHSPRRLRSPPPQLARSPAASPILAGQGISFKPLAARPGLVFTKSLPRTPAVFGPLKARRGRSGTITQEDHVRGAIDIVKGLEQKRQRRREKFYQKYCNRARKNAGPTKRPVPGQGAQRMREVGLTMAGKLGQGNFVLSI